MSEFFANVIQDGVIVLALLVLIGIAAAAIYGLKKLFKKLNIEIDANTYFGVIDVVDQVIHILDQRIVNKLKEMNPDRKLTDDQIKEINEKAVSLAKDLLNYDQVKFIMKKYEVDDIAPIILDLIDDRINMVRIEEDPDPIQIVNE